jgi:hypothetical protein
MPIVANRPPQLTVDQEVRMSLFKWGLGALATAAVLSTVGVPTVASAASATAAAYWHTVIWYHPANATTLAQCRVDGKNYGGTWRCQYYPDSYAPHQGQPHYELQVLRS